MLFRESFITDAGANIIARAAAGNGAIIWTRAATSNANTDGDSVSAMNALTDIIKTPTDSYTSSGVVTNAVVNDAQTSVAIYSEVTNEEYDGAACTFGAWAKIHGDEEDVLVIVARCGGATPTVINPASDGVVKAFVHFTLNISAEQAQAIEATEGYYATAAALQNEITARQDLASRVVTCHVADNETTGEAQNIYGEKTFITGICTSDIHDLDGSGIVTTGDIWSDAESDLGKDEWPWGDAYLTGVYTDSLYSKDYVDSSNVDYILLHSHIIPMSGHSLELGSASIPFDKIYSNTSYANVVRAFGGSTSIGTEQMPFGTSYANTYYGTNIGTSLSSFTDIYSTNLHGNLDGKIPLPSIPSSGTTLTVPIGAIVCVYVENQVVFTGMTYTIGSGDTVYTATLSGRGAALLPTGTYTALCDSNDQGGPCMMIRTA